jgi:N-acyl-L-homoserine lactone synthetase
MTIALLDSSTTSMERKKQMPVRIKIAETAAELDELFIARHKVFVEEEGYLASRNNGRIVDQFDAFPTTTNIIAEMEGHVVGGIRITTGSSSGLPSDHFYHFSPFFQDNPNAIAGVSQFFLRKSRRANNYRIGILLMAMCAYWATKQQLTHLVAAVNPVIAPLLKLGGMKPVGPEFFHDGEGVHVLPMALDMKQIKGPVVSILKRQKLHHSLETFEREYYLAGEKIDVCGRNTSNQFIVLEGKVCVLDQSQSGNTLQDKPLMELGPGQSFTYARHFFPAPQELHLRTGRKTELVRQRRTPINYRIPMEELGTSNGNDSLSAEFARDMTVH